MAKKADDCVSFAVRTVGLEAQHASLVESQMVKDSNPVRHVQWSKNSAVRNHSETTLCFTKMQLDQTRFWVLREKSKTRKIKISEESRNGVNIDHGNRQEQIEILSRSFEIVA